MERSKRSKKKRVIIILIVILLLLLGLAAGAWFYFLSLGDPGEMGETIRQDINRVTEEILADIEADNQGNNNNINSAGSEGADTGNPPGTGNNIELQSQEAALKATYDAAFYRLQGEGNRLVGSLLSGFKADYRAMKAQGKTGSGDLAKLAASYKSRASVMEKSMDSSVNAILNKMEEDMKAKGIDNATIQKYKNQYLSEYKRQKNARRSQILAQAKGYL